MPKTFIEENLMVALKSITKKHGYFSFVMLCTSIEFIGKCLNGLNDWNVRGREKEDFNIGLKALGTNYERFIIGDAYVEEDIIRKKLRNGFCHSLKPQKGIILTTKKDNKNPKIPHLTVNNGEVLLVAEDLLNDILKALSNIIAMDFSNNSNDKMNDAFIKINS